MVEGTPLLLQKKNTNVIIIVYAASLNFFLISFVYKRECLPNRTRGMTTMIFVFFRTHFFFFKDIFRHLNKFFPPAHVVLGETISLDRGENFV